MPEFEKIKWLKEKVLYGRPDWADKNRYLDDRYKKLTGRTPINSLEELVRQTVMRIYNPTIL
ncbi:MAG: hypothetical protein LBF15_03890 [Candidatus Peribacteria bacterium]|jgi:hypothetical protein|nr:hypothetical protein [Candidatus Peribacteria bacterium]